jgi:hypothetical protein
MCLSFPHEATTTCGNCLNDAAIPFCHLEDLGKYVHWIFSTLEFSSGLNLKVAIEHVPYDHLVDIFTKVTSKRAQYCNITIEEEFTSGRFASVADLKIGSDIESQDPTLLTCRQNFSAWWRLI